MAPKIRTIGSVYFEDYRLFRWSECKGIARREMGQKRLFSIFLLFLHLVIVYAVVAVVIGVAVAAVALLLY